MKRLMLTTMTLTLLAATSPARASEDVSPPSWRLTPATPPQAAEVTLKPKKDPGLAAGLSIAAPLAFGLAGLALHQANPGWALDGRWSMLDATLVVAPIGLSAGYFYAGEPADGMLIGLFGATAMAAGTYFARGGTLQGTIDPAQSALWPLLVGTGLTLVAAAFAVSDVRDVVAQKNKEK